MQTRADDSGYPSPMNKIIVQIPSIPIANSADAFPVRRIFCIGTNYAAHAREMGNDPNRQPPFYFSKSADTVVPGGGVINYPPRTENLHHEIEFVVAIGKGGADVATDAAKELVFGYAVGIDLTRRDLQAAAKNAGRPWDTAKNFDQCAPISTVHTVEEVGHPDDRRIWLSVNGEVRQDGNLDELIWSVPEAIAEISTFCALAPGDLIFTGTPAGVGPIAPGDKVTGGVDGVDQIEIELR